LKKLVEEKGVQSAFVQVSGLSEDHELVTEVIRVYNNIHA